MDGEGTLTYKQTKNKFEGFWKQDQKHGKGIWTYAASGKQEIIEYIMGEEI
jgi:hypothetical protein